MLTRRCPFAHGASIHAPTLHTELRPVPSVSRLHDVPASRRCMEDRQAVVLRNGHGCAVVMRSPESLPPVQHLTRPARGRRDAGCYQGAVLPRDAYAEAAPSSESEDFAAGPGRGQRGEKLQMAAAALQQHLDHRRRPAQVPVYLEDARRVQVQETACDEARGQMQQMPVGVLCFAQPRRATCGPRPTPPRMGETALI